MNGSNWLLVMVGCLLFACTTPRKATKPPTSNVPDDEPEMVRVYDPVTDSYVLRPKDEVAPDTISWTTDPAPPVVEEKDIIPVEEDIIKSSYEVTLLLPLSSTAFTGMEEHADPRLNRFIQYYSGMLIAMDELAEQNAPIRLRTIEAEGNAKGVMDLMESRNLDQSDLLIGPYSREDIEAAATFAMTHRMPLISPWMPAFHPEKDNPYLIHLTPGLERHAEAIMNFLKDEMASKDIVLVARDVDNEINRLQLFAQHDSARVRRLIISDKTPDLVNTNLSSYFSERGTVFILPYYSRQDEQFVNSLMRKLHAERGTNEVILFGLPQWTGFHNLNSNYMESLALHITQSSFAPPEQLEMESFKQKYFERFHTVPDLNAFQGYDLVKWLAHALKSKGIKGLTSGNEVWENGLSTGFQVQPVYPSSGGQADGTPSYFENASIRILKFVDQDFVLIR